MSDCSKVVDENRVQIRGWDYPHVQRNTDHGGQRPVGTYFESWTDWTHHIEFWRMYRSTQFLHYAALWEDHLSPEDRRLAQVPDENSIGVVNAIYRVTEIFEFLARLVRADLYASGVRIDVSLNNIRERHLWVDEFTRMPFYEPKITGAAKLQFARSMSASDVLTSSSATAVDCLLLLFDGFGWNPAREQIEADQAKFVSRRFG